MKYTLLLMLCWSLIATPTEGRNIQIESPRPIESPYTIQAFRDMLGTARLPNGFGITVKKEIQSGHERCDTLTVTLTNKVTGEAATMQIFGCESAAKYNFKVHELKTDAQGRQHMTRVTKWKDTEAGFAIHHTALHEDIMKIVVDDGVITGLSIFTKHDLSTFGGRFTIHSVSAGVKGSR